MTQRRGVCALVLAAAAAACAQPMVAPGDDFGRKPWEEQRALLPPYPKGGLVPVYVGPVRPFDFFVDPGSVSVGNDGVVRYMLIARSASGAVNASYEGIRCANDERKTYAFGAAEGAWSQARNSEWIKITRMQANQHAALADDFFCWERSRVRTTEDVRWALTRGNQPR